MKIGCHPAATRAEHACRNKRERLGAVISDDRVARLGAHLSSSDPGSTDELVRPPRAWMEAEGSNNHPGARAGSAPRSPRRRRLPRSIRELHPLARPAAPRSSSGRARAAPRDHQGAARGGWPETAWPGRVEKLPKRRGRAGEWLERVVGEAGARAHSSLA